MVSAIRFGHVTIYKAQPINNTQGKWQKSPDRSWASAPVKPGVWISQRVEAELAKHVAQFYTNVGLIIGRDYLISDSDEILGMGEVAFFDNIGSHDLENYRNEKKQHQDSAERTAINNARKNKRVFNMEFTENKDSFPAYIFSPIPEQFDPFMP